MQYHGRAFVLHIFIVSARNVRLGLSRVIQRGPWRNEPPGCSGTPRGCGGVFFSSNVYPDFTRACANDRGNCDERMNGAIDWTKTMHQTTAVGGLLPWSSG